MKYAIILALSTTSALATPAAAQDFNGAYISIGGGGVLQPNDAREGLTFDTDRDGAFDESVISAAGGDLFAPGYCGGPATGTANIGCRNDKDGPEYFARLGYDQRMGNFVLGLVLEGGHSTVRDSVSGFSSEPARYTMSRESDWQAGARLRAGYTPGGGALFYVTGGGAYARLDNKFATTNASNSFNDNGKTNGWGYSAGGGAEVMVTKNIAVGLEYLYTDLKDKDYVVNVGAGSVTLNNPFLAGGGDGTDIRRGDPHFRTHSVRGTLSFRF